MRRLTSGRSKDVQALKGQKLSSRVCSSNSLPTLFSPLPPTSPACTDPYNTSPRGIDKRFANLLGTSRPFFGTARDTEPSSIPGPTVATPVRTAYSNASRSQSSSRGTQRGIGYDMFPENSVDAKTNDQYVDAIRPSTGATSEGDAVREKYGGLISRVVSQISQSGNFDPRTVLGSFGWCITYPPQDAALGQTQNRRKKVTRIVIGPPTAIRCNGCGATTRYTYARPSTAEKPGYSGYTYNPGCGLTKDERSNPDPGLETWQTTNCKGIWYDAANLLAQTEFVKEGNGRGQLEHAKAQADWVVGIHKRALELEDEEELVKWEKGQEWRDQHCPLDGW